MNTILFKKGFLLIFTLTWLFLSFIFLNCGKSPVGSENTSSDDYRPIDPPPNPKLTISEPEFDFGIVPQYSKVSHTFWLYSTGYDTLVIEKVIPG